MDDLPADPSPAPPGAPTGRLNDRTDAERGGDDRLAPDRLVTERLAADRAATEQRLAALTGDFDGIVAASADSNADDEHDPEGSTIAFERSQVGALIQQAREHLRELDAAEARLVEGGYGICESCGRSIAPARLAARPVARTCVSCA